MVKNFLALSLIAEFALAHQNPVRAAKIKGKYQQVFNQIIMTIASVALAFQTLAQANKKTEMKSLLTCSSYLMDPRFVLF
jgi:hypothetical protein